MTKATLPSTAPLVLPKSSLKPRSKSRPKSRAPSRSETPSRVRSRTAKPPEREEQNEPKKRTVGALPSYFTGFSASDVRPLPLYELAFLEWTGRDLLKSWEKGSRAFVNMHLSMYLYSPSTNLVPSMRIRLLIPGPSAFRGIRTSPNAFAAGPVGSNRPKGR